MRRILMPLTLAFACAASSMTTTEAASKCVIPKSWGRLVTAYPNIGGLYDVLIFEAEDGTVRKQLNNCKAGDKPHWEVSRE